jgi:hypothetical protein
VRFRASVQLECPWCNETFDGDIPLTVEHIKAQSPLPDATSLLGVDYREFGIIASHICPGPKVVKVATHVSPELSDAS